jgi:hypothetical protein
LYDGKKIHQREAKNHKEASEQGVKQTLEKYSVFLRVIMLGKENGNNGRRGFLME